MSVKLQGGQGNQLFQVAYGLSKGCRTFDISSFDNDSLRHYEMDQWDLDIELVHDPEAEQGYFQDEKYFDKELVYNLFRLPKGQPSDECLKMANRIQSAKDSCLIGVRRADYLWPERIHYHGVMSLEYYLDAIRVLPKKSDHEFFVFTDDPVWVKSRFVRGFTLVDVNGPNEKAWDIWLMSLCRHAICANSTFHWWGAWLGADRNGGTVVAPKKWFANEQVNAECSLVPERWIRV